MTTIATDGKCMAADSRSTNAGNIVTDRAQKLRRLDDGSIIATAGIAGAERLCAEWIAAGAHPKDKPPLDDWELLWLKPDGTAWHCGGAGVLIERDLPAAIGSGQEFAMGAMLVGASPVDAVQAACMRDIGSGGGIKVEYLKPPLEAVA